MDASAATSYVDAQRALDPLFGAGRRYYWKGLYLDGLGDDAIDLITERALQSPSPHSPIVVRHLGGAMGRVPAEATAFGDRSAPFHLSVDATWDDPAHDALNVLWTREFIAAAQRFSSGKLYLNFAGMLEEGEAGLRTTFGRNYGRLVDVKTAYDPGTSSGSTPTSPRGRRRSGSADGDARGDPARIAAAPDEGDQADTRPARHRGGRRRRRTARAAPRADRPRARRGAAPPAPSAVRRRVPAGGAATRIVPPGGALSGAIRDGPRRNRFVVARRQARVAPTVGRTHGTPSRIIRRAGPAAEVRIATANRGATSVRRRRGTVTSGSGGGAGAPMTTTSLQPGTTPVPARPARSAASRSPATP